MVNAALTAAVRKLLSFLNSMIADGTMMADGTYFR